MVSDTEGNVLYIDQYGAWKTVEELQAHATFGQHPEVKAGQTGPWPRDLPLSYEGLTAFLESMLVPPRDARNVSQTVAPLGHGKGAAILPSTYHS